MTIEKMMTTSVQTKPQATEYRPIGDSPTKFSLLLSSGPLFAFLVAGTGGSFAEGNLDRLNDWTCTRAFEYRPAYTSQNTDTRTTHAHLTNLRDVFDLKMSELADIFSVSRPAAYAWFEGTEPKPDTSNRIVAMSHIADRLMSLDQSVTRRLVRISMFDGKSLLQLFREGHYTEDAVNAIERVALGGTEAKIRASAGERNSRRRKLNPETVDAFSAPILVERG